MLAVFVGHNRLYVSEDREQIQLLIVFHWIVAAFVALCSLFPILHLIIGIGLVTHRFPAEQPSTEAPFPIEAFGWFFVAFSVAWILSGITGAVLIVLAARNLARRRRRMFCMVVAGLMCLFFPFGTALGAFTLVVLSRESVRALFLDSEAGTAVA